MNPNVTPEPLMKIAAGFMAAKHLFAANEIGLFAAISAEWTSAEEISERTKVPLRTARISADAMAALGLIEKEGNRYRNGEVAQTFLAGRTPADLRPFLTFWDRISYPKWESLATCLRTGEAAPHDAPTTEEARIFSEGVAAITGGAAMALPATYDFSRHRRLLDLGGGTGSLLAAVLAKNAAMSGTLMELPDAAAVARTFLPSKPGLNGRAEIIAGDFLKDPIPPGHDVVLVANVVHCLSPESNIDLFARTRAAVEKGARMLLVDFWLEPSHTAPLFPALMSGEFLVTTGEGQSYSAEEASGWLARASWKVIERKPLAGPQGLLVAEAT